MTTEDPIEVARRATLLRRQQSEAILPSDELYTPGVDFPAYGEFTPDLYHRLAMANLLLATVGANEVALTPSRLPLVNGFVDAFKRMFHDLALNYVRRLAVRQSDINHYLVRVLNELVAESTPSRDDRLAAIERRLTALEQTSAAARERDEPK